MRHTQILPFAALAMLLMAGCTKADTPAEATAKPVAVVNGTPISRDVWDLYVKTRHQGKTPGDLTAEEQNAALDELVKMYVGAQEAEKQKLGEGEPNARLELVGKSARAELLFKKFTEGKEPTEAELKAEYDARIAEAPKEEYHARHILVDEEAKAKELIAQLDKGGNFEQLAKDNSKDGSATEPDGQAVLGRGAAARTRKVHRGTGEVGIRLARHQARREARLGAAAIRVGQGTARPARESEKVRGPPRRAGQDGQGPEIALS
jgi:hypothetical protein